MCQPIPIQGVIRTCHQDHLLYRKIAVLKKIMQRNKARCCILLRWMWSAFKRLMHRIKHNADTGLLRSQVWIPVMQQATSCELRIWEMGWIWIWQTTILHSILTLNTAVLKQKMGIAANENIFKDSYSPEMHRQLERLSMGACKRKIFRLGRSGILSRPCLSQWH